jgi:uncharacterized protein (TIGR02678 family)
MRAAANDLPDVVERNRQEERQQALRALLAQPLMAASHPAFMAVRRHGAELSQWLHDETGWQLQIEPEFARLYKRPADRRDSTRGASTGHAAFTRRRYALLCLLLADLERSDAQITLARLGEAAVNAAADGELEAAGLVFTLEGRDERRDLVSVVRLLLAFGVLSRVAGSEDAFVNQQGDGDALYDINRRVTAALLSTRRGPSALALDRDEPDGDARLEAMSRGAVPDTEEARNRARRQALTARLLDDPVVYWGDLDDDARRYLNSQRSAITRRIQDATGLVPEIRAEGVAMVDPQNSLTDQRLPAEGTDGHATLLVAAHLAELPADTVVPVSTLAERIAAWRPDYRRYWRKSAQQPGAEWQLARYAVSQLRGLRLVAIAADSVRPLPALARFAVGGPRLPEDTDAGTANSEARSD